MNNDTTRPSAIVACLCAAWCNTCDDYRKVFDAEAARHDERVQFRWIDIEDEAALVGEVEVENFPTLIIVRAGAPLFYGTITPHARTLARLVDSALAGELAPAAGEEIRALALRLAANGS